MLSLLYICLAISAFAANAILCRLALKTVSIDPISFTQLRLLSASVVLIVLVKVLYFKARLPPLCLSSKKRWLSALLLFSYALLFSVAYTGLDVATGALLLFGAVQITMVTCGYISGQQLSHYQWLGVGVVLIGLGYLLLPYAQRPHIGCALVMVLSGICWGLYMLQGVRSRRPLLDNAYSFALTLPFILLLFPYSASQMILSWHGIILALLSGGIMSALGYAIWYKAVTRLAPAEVSGAQLMVPVVTAVGGVGLLSEPVSLAFIIASAMVLGGVTLVLVCGPKNATVQAGTEDKNS